MEVATTKEARALSIKTKAITPGTLKEVLSSYATKEYADTHGGGGGGTGLVDDVKVNGTSVVDENKIANVSVPTLLSQLSNDMNFIQLVDSHIPDSVINDWIKNQVSITNSLPSTGTEGRLYALTTNDLIYRWVRNDSEPDGGHYVELSESLHLGETQYTAYRGDRGKIAYDHSQIVSGNPHGLTLSTFGISITAETINYLSGLNENILNALAKKLNLTGGTMTGDLILNQDPFTNMQAATKRYVDNMYDEVSIRVTQNATTTRYLARYLDGYYDQSKTNVDTVATLTNKMEGYDTYYECPYIKFDSDTNYYSLSENTIYVGTKTTLYEPSVQYYFRTGEGTVQDPYVYTLMVPGTDYEVFSVIPYDEPIFTSETQTTFNLLTPGTDYIIGSDTYKVTQDTNYLVNKEYFRKGADNTWVQLEPEVDYHIGDPTTQDDYEFDNIWIKKRTEGLNQVVQNNKQFIKEQTETNAEISSTLTTIDTSVKSLNTSVNGGEIYIVTQDRVFQQDKTYYYLNGKDQYKVYTGWTAGDLIVTKQEYQCDGTETGGYYLKYDNNEYYFMMPSGILDDDKLIFDIENEKLYLNEIDPSKEISTASSGTGTELTFLDVPDITLYETQLQQSMSEIMNGKYQDVVDKLSKYATTESVSQSIKSLQETTTSSYKRIDIQNILKGIGWVLTDDPTYQAGKRYYNIIGGEYTPIPYSSYTVGDPIPKDSSGFNSTIYEKLVTESMKTKSGRFDEDGLTIEQRDENDALIGDSKSTLNNDGLTVKAVKNGAESVDPILFAGSDPDNPGESVVKATNINVKTYLYAANQHLRIEQYIASDNNISYTGWGGFYL